MVETYFEKIVSPIPPTILNNIDQSKLMFLSCLAFQLKHWPNYGKTGT